MHSQILYCNIHRYPAISADKLLYQQIFVVFADIKSHMADNLLNHIWHIDWLIIGIGRHRYKAISVVLSWILLLLLLTSSASTCLQHSHNPGTTLLRFIVLSRLDWFFWTSQLNWSLWLLAHGFNMCPIKYLGSQGALRCRHHVMLGDGKASAVDTLSRISWIRRYSNW